MNRNATGPTGPAGDVSGDLSDVRPETAMTATPPQPPQPSSNARRWGIPFAVVGAVVLTIIIASLASSPDPGSGTPSKTQLEAAREYCAAGTLGDGGHTLIVDVAGKKPGSGTASIDDLGCVLGFLGAPDSAISRIDSTRAMDGMQDVEWDGLSASWTYHPDAGVDITITDN